MDELRTHSWPPVKGAGEKCTLMLMKLSFWLRQHPMRFMYSDAILKLLSPGMPGEDHFFHRDWKGSVWDVGASIGKFTAALAKANPNHLVYAFEPNLNSLYYLGARTAGYSNVVIVPCALTKDGASFKTTYNPDFFAPPTGPSSCSLSLTEVVAKFGRPSFAKFDIEGGEYFVFDQEPEILKGTHLLIEWHAYKVSRPIPNFTNWRCMDAVPDNGLQVTRYYEPYENSAVT